jgi:PmbA protein
MSLDSDWESVGTMARGTIKLLEKKGVSHAEAFFTSTQTTRVTIRNSEILTQTKVDDSGVGFRVISASNRVGFACTNAVNEKAVVQAGEKAFTLSRVGSEVPHVALPTLGKRQMVNGIFDRRVAEKSVDEAVEIAKRMIDAAEGLDNRVVAKAGAVVFSSGWRGIVNTLGIDCEEQETRAVIYLGGSGQQNGEVTSGCYDYMFKRTANLDPDQVGENVGRMAIDLFNAKPLKSFEGPVIFGPQAVAYQLVDVLIAALQGENAVAGRSPWTRAVGQIVASEDVTITDKALLSGGFASRGFDDEGCPSQNTILIKNGRLETFLHNATSANALQAKNTANASRFTGGFDMVRMIVGNGYRTKPDIYPTNLEIAPGTKTRDELVSEIAKGVLIELMAGFPQAASGMISAQLSRAFYIENGEMQHPIKGGMVSGVAFDWFRQISGIGTDSTSFQNSVVPSLQVEAAKVMSG